MRQELRRALDEVARRFRRARLWSGLAICWAAWAVVGLGWYAVESFAGTPVMPFEWLVGALVLAAATGLCWTVAALRSARNPPGSPAASRQNTPSWRPASWPPLKKTPARPPAG